MLLSIQTLLHVTLNMDIAPYYSLYGHCSIMLLLYGHCPMLLYIRTLFHATLNIDITPRRAANCYAFVGLVTQ